MSDSLRYLRRSCGSFRDVSGISMRVTSSRAASRSRIWSPVVPACPSMKTFVIASNPALCTRSPASVPQNRNRPDGRTEAPIVLRVSRAPSNPDHEQGGDLVSGGRPKDRRPLQEVPIAENSDHDSAAAAQPERGAYRVARARTQSASAVVSEEVEWSRERIDRAVPADWNPRERNRTTASDCMQDPADIRR